jgi:ATP-binding cassette subfamily F protein uup
MILIDAERLAASRPNRPLFADVSVTISDGDRLGVVGLNGSGKSTLLRMLAGELRPESGEVRWGRGARVGFLLQNPVLPEGTVREAVGAEWQGEAMLDRLGMTPLLDAPTDELSGGQAKRAALARLLVGEYEVLILDEPTNHLDLDAIQFLEEWLAAYRGGLVVVTHDRHVLDKVTTKVLELDRGTAYLHVPTGWHAGSGYAAYLAGRAEREERAEVAEQVRKNLATRELAWLRRGAPARTSKPKARIATATALVEGRAQAAARDGELGLSMGSKRLGTKGIELADVAFAWPDGTPHGTKVLDPCSLVFEPGDRVGVVGANGAGKSTLLDLVAGRLAPTAGTVDRGATVQIGYYDQLGRDLDLTQRVREAIAGDKGEPSLADVALMRRFWFDGDAQFAPISTLSGGERRRLQLLLTLVPQPNVLLLDEPTNDLDLDTLRAMEDFLDDWPGIVVTVSHDRAFLDRVTDELLALDGTGGVRWIRGGVGAWLVQRAEAAAPMAPAPATSSSVGAKSPGASRATKLPQQASRSSSRSPSTVRRQLGQAERAVATAVEARDQLAAQMSSTNAHWELTTLGEQLAAAQAGVAAAEETWLALAAEAESLGLTP